VPGDSITTSTFRVRRAAGLLAGGGVVAYPTDAVYGLGCDPLDVAAVARILALKDRSPEKGLILVAADRDQLRPFVDIDAPSVRERIGDSWPGPVTWLVPALAGVPEWLTGAHETLAVRVTAHAGAAALCRAFGGAIVSTSANRSGRAPARTALAARLAFGAALDDILPGRCGDRREPSTIRDARTGETLRG
jgi:L-threonylcarbamoyladenylate synthase